MSTENEQLIPVFVPALGVMLLHAEDAKGTPLTETEALRIRDKAPCIMLQVADARKMDESRGYRDIDPENCWHDWQNLRAELGREPALPPGPRFNQVSSKDEEFQQTIEAAHSSLNQFRSLIAGSQKAGVMPMIKTRLVDGEHAAFMWLCNAREIAGGFAGNLFEVPANFKNYRTNDTIEVPVNSIVDWMVNDNGTLYGGYSIRLIRTTLSEAERTKHDAYIGVTRYAPV